MARHSKNKAEIIKRTQKILASFSLEKLQHMRIFYYKCKLKQEVIVRHMMSNNIVFTKLKKEASASSVSKHQLEHGIVSNDTLAKLEDGMIILLRNLDSEDSKKDSRRIRNTHSRTMAFKNDMIMSHYSLSNEQLQEDIKSRTYLKNDLLGSAFYKYLDCLYQIDHHYLDTPYPLQG